jgi:glycosyltransferase involved in cell wall biosynthesis
MSFSPLSVPMAYKMPERLTDVSSWHGLIPLAFVLMDLHRPRVFVELGTHMGDSYCAFCQAVSTLELPTSCRAVDTWLGDGHAGMYDSSVYDQLKEWHDPRFGRFSTLIRSTFDQALTHFSDGSIDLLHIDGLHTYEAVRHDFENWLPKMSNRGLILFHDTTVRERDFGVWRLWEELAARYPAVEFRFSHGLGLIGVGTAIDSSIKDWFSMDTAGYNALEQLFFSLGERVVYQHRSLELKADCLSLRETVENLRENLESAGKILQDALQRETVLQGQVNRDQAQLKTSHQQNEQLRQSLVETEQALARSQDEVAQRDRQLTELYQSTSWRVTKLLRVTKVMLRKVRGKVRGTVDWFRPRLQHFARRMSHRIPLPLKAKVWLKEAYLKRQILMDSDTAGSLIQDWNPLLGMAESAGRYDPSQPWLLVVDFYFPSPDKDSGSMRMSGILRLLREQGFHLTFAADNGEEQNSYRQQLEGQGIETLQGYSTILEHLGQHGGKYRYAILSRPDIAFRYLPVVRAFALNAEVAFDTVDLHWVRMEREMEISGDCNLKEQIARYRRIELFNTACSDMVLAITPEEKARLLEELPDARVEILPNIHDPQPLAAPFAQRKGLMFIGGFWHKPNEDAVRYFVDQILPLVVEAIPDIVFYIVGSNMPRFIKAMHSEHIEPLGYIADVEPYFSSCRVFVAPLRYGAGMKGKIGQSIAYGLPVVTTTIGAEGMGLVDGQHMLLADTPEAFADAVIRLYFDSDLWHRLSINALAHLQEHYSLAATRRRLAAMFPLPEAAKEIRHQSTA